MNLEILINGRNEIGFGMKYTAPDSVCRQVSEEAFHHVEPGRAGGGEVEMEVRISLLPGLDFCVFVRRVVVADHMDLPIPSYRLLHQI